MEGLGFKLNQYDPCVANNYIDGSQCTIWWYVDDNKILHKKSETVDWVINKIESKFGKMTAPRGKWHTFVGMDFEILDNGKLKIMMKDYKIESVKAFGEEVKCGASTPARNDLFEISDGEDNESLGEDKSDWFHHIILKLLYVSKRVRLDIDLTIAFLCTRVSKSTVQDYNKLRRLLQYLKGTLDMPRILGTNGLELLQTWVDASYTIHQAMRGHTGVWCQCDME